MLLKSIFLGIVQGLTEFFPISSSGHLVFFQEIFGLKEPEILFDVVLHLGTLLAILIYLRKDLVTLLKNIRFLFLIILGNFFTALVALPFKETVEKFFVDSLYPAVFLIITGILLFSASKFSKGSKTIENFSIIEVIFVGIVQGISVLPGISRSGATISTGMFLGWNRIDSAKFSFLISIPSVLGATIIEAKKVPISGFAPSDFIAGFVFALISGIFALYFLFGILGKAKLHYFSYYCWVVGVIVLLIRIF
ncbi:MAG: undecaprenyl-diphosphate phosphatase [Endomicrobiia bacterium]